MRPLGIGRPPGGSAGPYQAAATKMGASPDLGGMFPSQQQPVEGGLKPCLKSRAADPTPEVLAGPRPVGPRGARTDLSGSAEQQS